MGESEPNEMKSILGELDSASDARRRGNDFVVQNVVVVRIERRGRGENDVFNVSQTRVRRRSVSRAAVSDDDEGDDEDGEDGCGGAARRRRARGRVGG